MSAHVEGDLVILTAVVAGSVLAPRTSAAGMFFATNKRMLKYLQEREYAN